MVIWNRKTLPPELANQEVPGSVYGLSPKGWIDQELFDLWFSKHFLRYAPPTRPLLLLLDGHSSHYCPSSIKHAARERVIVITLPPNTTHLTQPLDKGIFGPVKIQYPPNKMYHNYLGSSSIYSGHSTATVNMSEIKSTVKLVKYPQRSYGVNTVVHNCNTQ